MDSAQPRTGPECYEAAIECLNLADDANSTDEESDYFQQRATAYALLANAAATALTPGREDAYGRVNVNRDEWMRVAGEPEDARGR